MNITENKQAAIEGGDPQADRLQPRSSDQANADIADHGLIGDRRTAALVTSDGTIDWWCLPAFDGDIVFGAILDGGRGGFWRLGPRGGQHGDQVPAAVFPCRAPESRDGPGHGHSGRNG